MKVIQVEESPDALPVIISPIMDYVKIPSDAIKCNDSSKIPGKPILLNAPVEITCDIDTTKVQEPKFVPFEPYKAAVKPILNSKKKKSEKSSKLNSEISDSIATEILQEIAIPFPLKSTALSKHHSFGADQPISSRSQYPLIRVNRRVRTYSGQILERDGAISPSSIEPAPCCRKDEVLVLEEEIRQLKEDKQNIESQLQTQTQVNAELKKLLVASVGEDIQQRVQFLTEDKARLAEDIVNYSQRLINDYEELEKLSIQCDVWRSKYMASSVMVDELAKWKALLSRKFEESKQVMEIILSEHKVLREHLCTMTWSLHNLKKSFDPTNTIDIFSKIKKSGDLNSLNLLQISTLNAKLIKDLMEKLLGKDSKKISGVSSNFAVIARTQGEECAYQVLSETFHSCHNEVGDMMNFPTSNLIGSSLKYVESPVMFCNSCSHCSGEIQQI